jgi:hypothetical protein
MNLTDCLKTISYACLLPAALLFGADDTSPPIRRPSLGFRIEYFASPLFSTATVQTSTTKPVADYTYTGSTPGPRASLAPMVEYRLTKHLSLGVELHYHQAEYQQTTDLISGVKDPNSNYDDRQKTTIAETTRTNYWEVPLVARYCGFRRTGGLNNAYVLGGVEWRHVGRIRTGTEFAYADGTTDYNEIPARPDRTNQAGVFGGIGYRIVNTLRMKFTPEVRFVHWQGISFQGITYRSARNQVELSLGWSY